MWHQVTLFFLQYFNALTSFFVIVAYNSETVIFVYNTSNGIVVNAISSRWSNSHPQFKAFSHSVHRKQCVHGSFMLEFSDISDCVISDFSCTYKKKQDLQQ